MNESFGDWYRLAELEPNDDLLRRRWSGVTSFAANCSPEDTLSLVGIFCSLAHDQDSESRFRQAFLGTDAAFQMRGNDVELSCLAGATIAEILASPAAATADLAALAVVCSDFRGLRRRARLVEIVNSAESYLVTRSRRLRENRTGPSAPGLNVDERLATLQSALPGNDLQAVGPPLIETLKSIVQAVKSLEDVVQALARERDLRIEESDILWWLQGEYSRDLDQPLALAPWPAVPIHVGKELSDIIRVLPGPYPMRAFLSKALLSATKSAKAKKTVHLSDAVVGFDQTKCPMTELHRELEPHCPVLLAIAKRRDMSSPDQWLSAFDSITGVPAHTEISPLDLAMQTCRERLLQRAASNLKA
jgi:hypothetical protein